MKPVYLFLENGMRFCGKSCGFEGDALGELVFTTAMGGFLETLTDGCYYGQIVLDTFPVIGSYGVITEDLEGKKPALSGFIARELCDGPSNFRCEGTVEQYLKDNKIVALCGVDTRKITKILRDDGVMNCIITDREELTAEQKEALKSYHVKGAVEALGAKEKKVFRGENPKRKVVLWGFGEHNTLLKELVKRDCEVVLMPYNSTAKDIAAENPDGIAMSDGAGDPADNESVIKEMKEAAKLNLPIFAMGLSHQMFALSQGGKTSKLRHGHRGASQPVVETDTGRILITAQNRGYTVSEKPQNSEVTYRNVNDKTVEGLSYTGVSAYSLEFMPCDASGPIDTSYILDRFISMIGR